MVPPALGGRPSWNVVTRPWHQQIAIETETKVNRTRRDRAPAALQYARAASAHARKHGGEQEMSAKRAPSRGARPPAERWRSARNAHAERLTALVRVAAV